MATDLELMRRFCPADKGEVCWLCGANVHRDECRVELVRDQAIAANLAEIERLRAEIARLRENR